MVQAIRATSVATDNDGSKLGDTIRRFADNSVSLAKHWVLRHQNTDSFLLAIFREIDETVLPREITLSTDANVEVRLLIANRRLLSLEIEENSEQPDQPDQPETCDTETVSIENVAQFYTSKLHSVINRSNELHIQSTARELVSSSNRKSCSAHSLAASVGLPLRTTEQSENMSEFSANVEKLALASVRYRKKLSQTIKHGDDSLTDLLMGIGHRSYSNATRLGPSASFMAAKPFCNVFRLNVSISVIVAHDRDERALFAIPTNKVSFAMTLWQNIFAIAP